MSRLQNIELIVSLPRGVTITALSRIIADRHCLEFMSYVDMATVRPQAAVSMSLSDSSRAGSLRP